jgi:hypothetical protein
LFLEIQPTVVFTSPEKFGLLSILVSFSASMINLPPASITATEARTSVIDAWFRHLTGCTIFDMGDAKAQRARSQKFGNKVWSASVKESCDINPA